MAVNLEQEAVQLRRRIAALEQEVERLKADVAAKRESINHNANLADRFRAEKQQLLNDLQCLPSCDNLGHNEKCPVAKWADQPPAQEPERTREACIGANLPAGFVDDMAQPEPDEPCPRCAELEAELREIAMRGCDYAPTSYMCPERQPVKTRWCASCIAREALAKEPT